MRNEKGNRDRADKLIGKRLSISHRALNMECFHFGRLKTNNDRIIGELALHVQCDWRIIGQKLLVGSRDINFRPNGEYDGNIDWDNQTLRDKKLKSLIRENKLIVSQISVDEFGGFKLKFESGQTLEVIPLSSSDDEYYEYWRLLTFTGDNNEHFVVRPNGIEK